MNTSKPISPWKKELANAFKDVSSLYHFLNWDIPSDAEKVSQQYPLFIPPFFAERIKKMGPNSALAKQFLPHSAEIFWPQKGLIDPIGDEAHLKAPQLIHRYDSRALFLPTTTCPIHCRYCFRKNELSVQNKIFKNQIDETFNYVRNQPNITEIIFTGGDPLTLSNEKMDEYLHRFSQIGHVQDIRFHTRYPVILPQRFDDDFFSIINKFEKKFRTITLGIHINHIDELSDETKQILKKCSETCLQLLSQTVLLREVNDNLEALLELFRQLISLRIRPYYLHHPDQVEGAMNYTLNLEEGRKIYGQLRNQLPGWAIPHYVIDIPGGHGKVSAFNPETFSFGGTLLTKEGQTLKIESVK